MTRLTEETLSEIKEAAARAGGLNQFSKTTGVGLSTLSDIINEKRTHVQGSTMRLLQPYLTKTQSIQHPAGRLVCRQTVIEYFN